MAANNGSFFLKYDQETPVALAAVSYGTKTNRTTQAVSNSDSVIPESTANVFSRWTYSWMNALFRLGYTRALTIDDIWRLSPEFETAAATREMSALWEAEKMAAKAKGKDPRLAKAIRTMVFWPVLQSGLLRSLDVSYLVSPLLIKYLVQFLEAAETSKAGGQAPQPLLYGLLYAFAMFLLTVLSSFLQNHYTHMVNLQSVRLKSALNSMMFEKTTKLSNKVRSNFNAGKLTTLLSTDINRIQSFLFVANQVWIAPLQIALILLLLVLTIGYSAFVGVGILILTIPLQQYAMGRLKSSRAAIAPLTDQRIKMIQELLHGIRAVKYFAWEDTFAREIEAVRVQEIVLVFRRSVLNAAIITLAFSLPSLASTVTFIVYALVQTSFSASGIFASFAWFSQLRFPLLSVPTIIVARAEYTIAVKRIQDLLMAEDIDEKHKINPNATYALNVVDADFIWESLPPFENKGTLRKLKKNSGSKDKLKQSKSAIPNVDHKPFKLEKINLQIPIGALVAVVGSVGSGKSSLLHALISEMKMVTGAVQFSGKTGFTAQQPWALSASIKDNILFGQPYEEVRYLKVLQDCGLERDLKILEDGDMTTIGERGVNLSGGQKQRISLARLIYANCDIVLMDSPLSAIDSQLGSYIFQKCIVEELAGKTRIFVTHELHFLPNADYIIVMKDGRISEQGTYANLVNSSGDFSIVLQEYAGYEGSNIDSVAIAPMPKINISLSRSNLFAYGSISRTEIMTSHDQDPGILRLGRILRSKHAFNAKTLIKDEERATGSISLNIWGKYVAASGGWLYISALFLLLLITQSISVGTTYWLVIWTNHLVPSFSQLSYMGVYLAGSVLQSLFYYISFYYFSIGGTTAANSLHRAALNRVLHAPEVFFETTPIGRIINRFSKDQDGIDNALVDALRIFLSTTASCIGYLALIIYGIPLFAVPLIPILISYFYIQKYYRHVSLELKRVDSIAQSPIYTLIGECLAGLPTIRAFSEEKRFIEQNNEFSNRRMAIFYILSASARWLGLRLEIIGSILVLVAAVLGVVSTSFSLSFFAQISPALYGLTLSYALDLVSTMNWCVRQFTEAENAMNAVERMTYYGYHLGQEASYTKGISVPPKNWPLNGAIEFSNVDIRYGPELPLALKNVSFSIAANEKIGVCGRTGSGKSSLIKALFRTVECSAGKITIDGLITKNLGLKVLRSSIGIIPQDPVLFSGTFRFNLDPLSTYTDDEIWQALDRAKMKEKCLESGGLEGIIGEGGENLSLGQRQLVCLARAMLIKPKVLVMDEATANVDVDTDVTIQACLRSDMGDSTILTIAHRLNTIVDYDRVMVMVEGEVKEFDTPSALMNIPDGIFRSMVLETGAQCMEMFSHD